MKRDRYISTSDLAHETYEFLSSGPKGTIKKVVQFISFKEGFYNLGFGDWDDEAQTIRDDVRTNNNDKDKILTTVAFTVIDFMEYHPAAIVFAEGSTPARTRLYQMGIADNLAEIGLLFDIGGYFNGDWEPFRKGRNYQIFSVKAKKKL